MLKSVLLVLKIAISGLLLLLVISFVDFDAIRPKLMHADPFWLSLSLVALACQFIISMLRWRDVAAALGLELTSADALSLGLVGQMFNQILPTNLGGDGVRILAMSRQGWVWTSAALTVLVDRAVGVLFIIAAAALSLLIAVVTGRPDIPDGAVLAGAVGALFVTVILLIVFAAPHAEQFQERHRWIRPIAWGLGGLHTVLSSQQYTPQILLKGLLVHLLLVQSFCFEAAALDIEITRELFMLVSIILLANAFPLSFAGWGVREGAMVTGLALIGVNPTDALLISVLHGVGQIIIGLPGAAWLPMWLFGKRDT